MVDVAARPEFAIRAVTCHADHAWWSPPEIRGDYMLVLVRRGRFRRRAAGFTAEVDPTLAYLGIPGDEERFAHPAGGDVCTAVTLSPGLWRTVVGDDARPGRPTVYVGARLEVAHRRCLIAARTGDVDYAVVHELLELIAAARAQAGGRWAGRGSARDDARLVDQGREAILEDHAGSEALLSLADLLQVSPYRLSRAFTRELGVSLTRYRNRVRVGRALDRLEQGENSLADLAADLRFADQAHLSRTIREHVGHTPVELRRLLGRDTTARAG